MKKLFVLLFLVVGCVEEGNLTPESALQTFMEGRMGKVITRDFVIDRVTGKMKESFEHMSEEEFTQTSDLTNIDKDSFKILSKSCQKDTCFVTYTISYKTKVDDKAAFASEVKKIAEMQKVDGKWLIADVSNIKTYHEALEPLTP